MSSQDIVRLASRIATEAHQGQFRRDGRPYICHPEAVASRVAGDPVVEAIAWLHDVLEDTSVTATDLSSSGLPREVVECVELLTKRSDLEYGEYLARIKRDPLARRVKIADMLVNLSDSPNESQIVKYSKGLLLLLT